VWRAVGETETLAEAKEQLPTVSKDYAVPVESLAIVEVHHGNLDEEGVFDDEIYDEEEFAERYPVQYSVVVEKIKGFPGTYEFGQCTLCDGELAVIYNDANDEDVTANFTFEGKILRSSELSRD
jgi:hypothetical protein